MTQVRSTKSKYGAGGGGLDAIGLGKILFGVAIVGLLFLMTTFEMNGPGGLFDTEVGAEATGVRSSARSSSSSASSSSSTSSYNGRNRKLGTLGSNMVLLNPSHSSMASKLKDELTQHYSDINFTNKDWTIPTPTDTKCPDFCGTTPNQFQPFAKDPNTGFTLDKMVGSKTFYRVHRPDWIEPMHQAVAEIDKHGGMDGNSFCEVFSSCKATNLLQSRHSTPYSVCSEYDMVHASNILVGSTKVKLPGYLAEQGDSNQFCQMARFISQTVETTIFPFVGWENKKCIVQEFFINQQLSGSKTNMHNHNDDYYGGVFYLDVPQGTRLCFHDSERDSRKQRWYKWAPEFTEKLYPFEDAPHNYPGYVEPRAGDVIFFPVAWAQHWVPKMDFADNEKRTSVVFNMICM